MKHKILILLAVVILSTDGFSQTRLERREQRAGSGVVRTERGIDDPAAHAILDNIRRNLRSFRSLKFDFTLIMENRSEMERTRNTVGSGTILMRGDSYNMNFMEMTTISDGRTIWNFNAETNEVYISQSNPNDLETMNPLVLINTYEDHFRSVLIREEIENNVLVAVIDLRPFEARSFHRVRVIANLENNTLVRTEVHDKDGTVLTFRVDRMQTNVPAPNSEFTFSAARHPGVEVIDLR
ncbi:MAG: outer membrane lipoprotein carrier protein LolA [Bacteroidales bacterium]|nr:outer membrane lipoprotein carrier protein LolA [Bacteroidales bacterium]